MSGHRLRRALAHVAAGKTMDRTEAVALLAARDQELEQLCRAASLVRDAGLAAAGREGLITYSSKVFVPLTRLCRDRCHCRGGSVRGRSRGARQSAHATEVADLDVIPFHPGVSGLNASLSAAEEAVRTLWGAIPLAMLPADLPLATAALLDRSLRCAARHERAFIPDMSSRGTTMLFAGPGAALRPAYGPHSADAHERQGSCRLRHGGLDLLRQDVDDMADFAVVNRRFEDIR